MLQCNVSPTVGLLEFSLGKFRKFRLARAFPEEAILRHISSNVTFLIFQIHSQYQNTTVSFFKVSTRNDISVFVLGPCV